VNVDAATSRRPRWIGAVLVLATLVAGGLLGAQPALAAGPAVPAGLGPSWLARLSGHNQVVVASGQDWRSTRVTVTEWERRSGGWVRLGSWTGWNGLGGWTSTPSEFRQQSPVGAFSLTDAGGYAPNPGSRLPYDHSTKRYGLISHGVRTFSHVIAINYNRIPGRVPADRTRPGGFAAGGGFWIHTEHHSGSGGCITIPDGGVVQLQRTLTPAAHPVILMGPAAVLAR
jgi:L,D-peptidoglycan transpeptidase YkuD (ErfK/YbiS/YcfS/YnhG family)